MKKGNDNSSGPQAGRPEPVEADQLVSLLIRIRPDLYRAYQRCSWIIIHETGRGQLDIMQEMVEDFLIKYRC